MPPKSRANEARKRRRFQREMMFILQQSRNDDITSSDDDLENIPAPPVQAHVLVEVLQKQVLSCDCHSLLTSKTSWEHGVSSLFCVSLRFRT